MARYQRRALIGLIAGIASGTLLAAGLDPPLLGLSLGALGGVVFAIAYRPAVGAYLDAALAGATGGIPFWALLSVVVLPVLRGDGAQWELVEVQRLFSELVAWIGFGALLGVLVQGLTDVAVARYGPEQIPTPAIPEAPKRIVILGGGFGGVVTAEYLEAAFGADPAVELTLISETNALLFTPMLAEVAASSLEATHISTPLRTSLRRTRVIRGRVAEIDLERRRVVLESTCDGERPVEAFDHVVLALGAVSNYLGLENVAREAFDFKSLGDAIAIRNHVIAMFERADLEADPATRRRLLTFVVAGGGFAGAELAGGLNDFARGMLAFYPRLAPEEVQVVLVHSRDRILPELNEGLAAYALERMRQRGVTFKLGTRVADARRGAVILSPAEELPTETLVWTAGTTPNPLLATLPVERDRRGGVVVEGTLAVPGQVGVWALGDCAAVPNAATGETSPPTAQFALRQAKTLAHNIHASIQDKPLKPFRFKEIGLLCVVGHQTACAEIRGHRFSGLLAWLMWRAIYVGKLPGLERKAHVLFAWIIELFFPRDIVQTVAVPHERSPES
jgi:NADH:ubiquinone reductase (H+-translocating)